MLPRPNFEVGRHDNRQFRNWLTHSNFEGKAQARSNGSFEIPLSRNYLQKRNILGSGIDNWVVGTIESKKGNEEKAMIRTNNNPATSTASIETAVYFGIEVEVDFADGALLTDSLWRPDGCRGYCGLGLCEER